MEVLIKKVRPEAIIPHKAHNIDNGYDLYAAKMEYDKENDCYIYYTGIAIAVPIGYSGDVIPKSRHRKTPTYMPNTPGDVDPGYTGEIQVTYKPRVPSWIKDVLKWIHFPFRKSIYKEFDAPYNIGDSIAQFYLTKHPEIEFKEIDELPKSERGDKGHGSTGN